MVNYANVRASVNDLLHLAETEHDLEKRQNLGQPLEFTDSHRTGVLAFALATICLHVPQARDRLDKMINQKQQFIATLQKKR